MQGHLDYEFTIIVCMIKKKGLLQTNDVECLGLKFAESHW